jgi:hypothetical protein
MSANESELPDLQEIEAGLKDFQLRTARTVFRRLYQQARSTHRFLVADEVGLGKTLIARAVIARTLHHLWDTVDRIDIVYICSNADIARQNIKRLNVLGEEGKVLPTRITLLPIKLRDLNRNRINFISFTPGTSFDLKSNLGIVQERVLLYWLLQEIWQFSGTAAMNVFQGNVRPENFRWRIRSFYDNHRIDRGLKKLFRRSLRISIREARANGEDGLRKRFEWLCGEFRRTDSRITRQARLERSAFIGELRGLLAETCVEMLEPDLVIMDEFQRFKHLMSGEDDASVLARQLFEYADATTAVRVLLLSATPYKMYTLSDESGDEDHYRDFLDTLAFLYRDDRKTERFAEMLREYRYELLRFDQDSPQRLDELKSKIQRWLRRVIARTERLAVTDDRAGMLTQVAPKDVQLLPGDALAYVELQSITRQLEMHDTVEYWKSSSYLLNFMEDYKLKRNFHAALEQPDKCRSLSQALSKAKHLLLPWGDLEQYRQLDPRNARMRGLVEQVIGTGMWQLLWLPPALPYYELEGPFRTHDTTQLTKRLVFSSWRVVPKVISTVLSYEAERHAVKLHEPEAVNTESERERRSHTLLLRIAMSRGRATGMPVLALMYPCITLARRYDPLVLARNNGNGRQLRLDKLRETIRENIASRLVDLRVPPSEDGRMDEQWYWAAPILLDRHHYPRATRNWFEQPDLETQWAAEDSSGDDAWVEHVDRAVQLLAGDLELGRPPDDLADVLADLALGGPAICALRALDRFTGPTLARELEARNAAASVGWAFRSLYNRAEVAALLRGLKPTEPYWRRVLEYGAEGNLQAVLDEYVHVLKDALGLVGEQPLTMCGELAEAISRALTVRASVLAVDDIRPGRGTVQIKTNRLPSRFAMPFGQGRDDEGGDTEASRAHKVREAFNSPFWPFVVASTSIGQEGLDFHWYCHAIVHWNLPGNPVDMEQREGRIHRYKGHAVRKNLSLEHSHEAFQARDKDPWLSVFRAGCQARCDGENDLVPYWIYPVEGGARIQRHVPSLPMTRDRQLLGALRRSLAVYRMVFGQPRQDDLVEFLLRHVPREQLDELVKGLRIDLSP